jgi:hypothetical protein
MAWFWSLLARSLSLFFGLLFPAFQSLAAIESEGTEDDTQWLVYWLIYSILQIVEGTAWSVIRWIPLYQWLKIGLLAWLVLPQFKGAQFVYEALLSPAFRVISQELHKIPALQKWLDGQGYDKSSPQALSAEAAGQAQAARNGRLTSTLDNASKGLQQASTRIAGINDPAARRRAERAFEKDLKRIEKIISRDAAGMGSKPLGPMSQAASNLHVE